MGEEYEDECVECATPSARARRIDFLIVGVALVRTVVGAVHDALCVTETLLCSHANYQVDQRIFADEARREIETLTQEE